MVHLYSTRARLGRSLCFFSHLICWSNIFSFWLNFWVSPNDGDQPVLLLCAGVFPFLKSIVQIALSLHKILHQQLWMWPLLVSIPTAPSQMVLVSLISFPFSGHLNEDKEWLWLDSLPSFHRHDACFDERKLNLESKMFWWFHETGNPKVKTCLALVRYYRILIMGP